MIQKAAVMVCPITNLKSIDRKIMSVIFIHTGNLNTPDGNVLPKDLEFIVKQKDYKMVMDLGLHEMKINGYYLHRDDLIFLN